MQPRHMRWAWATVLGIIASAFAPFPGPHAHGYAPLWEVLWNAPGQGAGTGFYLIWVGFLATYGALATGALLLGQVIWRRLRPG